MVWLFLWEGVFVIKFKRRLYDQSEAMPSISSWLHANLSQKDTLACTSCDSTPSCSPISASTLVCKSAWALPSRALAAWAALATASGFWHHLSGSHAISGRQWQSHAGHTAGGQAPASVGLSLAEQPILPPCAGGADCSLPPGRRHLACGIPPCACLESGVSAAGGVARLPGGINSGLRYKAKQCCGRASLAASLHYLSSLPAVTAADMLAAVGDLHEPARLTAPPGNCTDESSSSLH